jgi:putative CocE/NonD family hydrolase
MPAGAQWLDRTDIRSYDARDRWGWFMDRIGKRAFSLAVAVLSLLLSGSGGKDLVYAQAATAAAPARYEVVLEHNVAAKMRDGVTLRADIYRPRAEGKFPLLLERTPYDKTGEREFATKGAARGYVVVVQDTRGRYASEGEWYTFKNEANDGYDTVEWAAALPYADGKVGMFGGSYVGATQFWAAIAHPPHLAGIAPDVTASNYHDGWTYQGGAFEQWFNQSWASGLTEDTLRRASSRITTPLEWRSVLPLADYPLRAAPDMKALAPYYADWLAHPSYDEYWKALSIEEYYAQIHVPVFNLAAWYDIFLGGSLRNYELMKSKAGSEAARKGQRLLVGLGGHAGGWEQRKIGDVDFGEKAPFDGDALVLDWYDMLLKGVHNAFAGGKPVRIFVMGRNEWRDEDDWPLARAKKAKYFLHSGGDANSAAGNGVLSTAAPASGLAAAQTKDTFEYDPANPVPTIGGPLCCRGDLLKPGPFDQKTAEERKDVLVYSTATLAKDVEVTGPVTAELWVSSSAVDTDITAKLVDVAPNGFAQNLTEGILRLRYRDSQERPEPLKPGALYKVTVDLWATSNVFLAGHKIRLDVSSSNFPRFDRNLNTGEEQARATRTVKATNTVVHDKEHPSALILPVVP